MAYYTERHTMREPVKKTYDISVDVYTLIFQCCEKYYNNLAWKYPDQCPDGYGCCGLDLEKLNLPLWNTNCWYTMIQIKIIIQRVSKKIIVALLISVLPAYSQFPIQL